MKSGTAQPLWMARTVAGNRTAYLLLLLAVLITFLPSVKFDFTYHDDPGLIYSDKLSLKNIDLIFSHGAFYFTEEVQPERDVYYRPMQNLFYAMARDIGGKKPYIYHLFSLALHFAASCLFFLFLLRMNVQRPAAFLIALVFIVHPVMIQAVAWIPGAGELLITIFILLAFLALQRALAGEQADYKAFILFAVSFLLALFSKESAVAFVPLVFLFLWLYRRQTKGIISRSTVLSLLVAGDVAVWYYFRQQAVGAYAHTDLNGIIHSVLQNIGLLPAYLGKIIIPLALSPLPAAEDLPVLPGILAMTGLALCLFFIKGKRNYGNLLSGVAWFVLFLLPTFYLVRPDAPFYAYNHRLYLPMAGLLLAFAEIFRINHTLNSKTLPVLPVLIVALYLCGFSYLRAFKNKYRFYETAVKNSPRSYTAYEGLGNIYAKDKHCDKAIATYSKIVELKPQLHDFYGLIGNTYMNCSQDLDQAMKWYSKGLAVDSTSRAAANTLISMGNIYSMALHDTAKAIGEYRKAIAINPSETFPMEMLGNIYYHKLQPDSSLRWYRKVTATNPSHLIAWKNMGLIEYNRKRYREATGYFEKVIEINPEESETVQYLMLSYFELKDAENTVRYAQKYHSLGGSVPSFVEVFMAQAK